MATQRIIISDREGNNFRVCKFGLMKDSRNENYVKFSFPDLKGKAGIFNDVKNDENIEINQENDINELSIHFISGISHFKSSKQERRFRKDAVSNIENRPLIHLMDFIIYDLNHFRKFTKQLNSLDYNQIKFDKNKGKILEFYLSKYTEDPIVIPTARGFLDRELIKMHLFADSEKKYRFSMIEWQYIDMSTRIGVTIHRKDDPGVPFQEVMIPI